MSTTSETLVVSTRANTNGGRLQVIYKSVTWRKVVKRTVCSSWSTAEVWLTEINHWEYYTNQPPTPMVSQEQPSPISIRSCRNHKCFTSGGHKSS